MNSRLGSIARFQAESSDFGVFWNVGTRVPYPVKNSSESGRLPGLAASLLAAATLVAPVGCSRQDRAPAAPAPAGAPEAAASAPHSAGIPPTPLWTNFEINSDVHAVAVRGTDVWVGTEAGLLRYDLTRDTVAARYDTSSGLLSNNVTSLDPAPDGGLWVGTHGGGLVHIAPDGTWTRHSVPELGDPFVYRALADVKGRGYWVATWSGLSHFDGRAWRTYTTADGLADDWVYAMAQAPDGTLWLGTEGGVSALKTDGSFTTYTHADGLGADKDRLGGYEVIGNPSKHHTQTPGKSAEGYNPNYVLSALIDGAGNRWFGTWGAGLSRFDGKTWRTYTRLDGLAGNYVTDLFADPDGSLWATTDAGVSVLKDGRWRSYTQADGLVSDGVFTLAVDKAGNKWFGAMGGVSRMEAPAGSGRT
jgi:ligand-binding sensor domain-containing protein